MFAYPISKIAGHAAKFCGATPEQANAWRAGVAVALTPVDPIGVG